jgi:hypothetical protein
MNRHLCLAAAIAALHVTAVARAPAGEQGSASRMAVLERRPFPVTIAADGVFVAPDATPVVYRPEASTAELEVVEAIEPGPVARGQCLLRFSTVRIDEQIRDAELELRCERARVLIQRQTVERADAAARIEIDRLDLDLAAAERALDALVTLRAPERLDRSESRLRDWEIERAEREQEFKILKDMYDADHVLEPAEKLDLESQRRRLDRASERHPRDVARHELLRDITIPREKAALELAVLKARLARDGKQATARALVAVQQAELESAEAALARHEEALAKLRRDREALTVTAAADGIAIPGRLVDGVWSDVVETERMLRPGARLEAGRVLFTIVQPANVVRTSIPEDRLLEVREGQDAVVLLGAASDIAMRATVTRVSPYGVDGRFQVWLTTSARHQRTLPGASCKVRIATSAMADALTVPASAIGRDDHRLVVHVEKDGSCVSRPVEVGVTIDGRTEIISGVAAGERVLAAAPMPLP